MIDNLYYQLVHLGTGDAGEEKPSGPYAVLTLHRPSNVDGEEKFREIMDAIVKIAAGLPVYFPVHPRTRQQIEATGIKRTLNGDRVHLLPALPYKPFLRLFKDAALVLTDSGGLQEETTALGIPCFTIRESTERPVTIDEGTNRLVGTSAKGILSAFEEFRSGNSKKGRVPELWDGKAAERIIRVLLGKAG